ncbi:TIGR04222 domain-containing membrane protein [Streptomyces sp. AJS327]|uniref:TIGR04222 domain-containing membrane protein n=1 Tax=Streptomyces sp. AJS327 TaxID=2545265 RepID=UPI0015DFC246|nr:TIGR04222 domain-containing membrane protein [Streptomyces sp. AJS327]
MAVHVLRAVVAVLVGLTLLTWAWLPFVRRRVLADYERAAAALPRRPVPEPGELTVAELALLAGGPTRVTHVVLTELYLTGALQLTRTSRMRAYAVVLRDENQPPDAATPDPLSHALRAVIRKKQPAPLKPLFVWGVFTDVTEPLWRSLEERGLRPRDRHLYGAQSRYALARLSLVLTMSLGAAVVLYGTFAGMTLAREVSAGLPYLAVGVAMVAGSGLFALWWGRTVGRTSPRTANGDALLRQAQDMYCRRFGEREGTGREVLPRELALRRLAVSGSLGTHLSASAHRALVHSPSPSNWTETEDPERIEPPLLWDFLSQQRGAVSDLGPFGSQRTWRRVEVPQGPEFETPVPDYFDSFYWQVPDHSH